MVRCPNCGSAAQVKVVYGDDLRARDSIDLTYVMQECKCGCGCEFMRIFKEEEIRITNKENLK